jgi:hypothetical protein
METVKTKSLKNLEQKMQGLEQGSLRYQILESAKNFKSSWVELGRALYSVWKDRVFKEWGYNKFDAYTAREIGIRKQTAMKLLRSYYFLEKEEPAYLRREFIASTSPAAIPNYETVDMLRLAKDKKKIDLSDYIHLKKEIFEKGKDAPEVKKDLTALIRQREELEPEAAWQKKRTIVVRRFLATLKTIKQEMEALKILPLSLLKEATDLIRKLEDQIP